VTLVVARAPAGSPSWIETSRLAHEGVPAASHPRRSPTRRSAESAAGRKGSAVSDGLRVHLRHTLAIAQL